MRILRLDGADWSVDLHPYVTVVAGLTDDQRAEISAAFQAAISGRTTSLSGLIEVHGVVLDLDERSLSLLDLDDVVVDAIVEPGDLPGAASTGLDRQLRAAERRLESLEIPYRERGQAVQEAQAALDAARAAAEEARAEAARTAASEEPDEALEALEAALAEAEAAVAALAEPGSAAAGELEQAERALVELRDDTIEVRIGELATLRHAFEERRRGLLATVDAGAAEAFGIALDQLRRLEAAATADADDEESAESDDEPDADDPEAIAARIEELRGILALHATFDPTELRSALDAIRLTPSVGELVPSPEALSLADRLEELDREVAELEAGAADAPVPGAVEEAAARLDEIRTAVIELERTSTPGNLDADIEELERAHTAVVDARERLEGRLGKGKAQTRYEEAAAAEEAVLDRLGIRTYTDYLTGGRAALYADAEPAELRSLRKAEREAEAELRALELRAQRALDLAAAGQDRRELRGRARTLLGDPSLEDHELTRALLAMRVPAESSSPFDELLDALEGVGLPVRALELSRDDAEALAADWLDEYYRAEDRRAALEHELEALEGGAPLGSFEPAAGLVPDDLVPADASALSDEDLEELLAAAQAAVRDAKDRMIAHETALREIDEIDIELESIDGAARQTEQYVQQVADAQVRVDRARAAAAALDEQRRAAEHRVAEARAALEHHRARPAAGAADAAAAVEAAEADVARAEERLQAASAELDVARSGHEAAVVEAAALRQALSDVAGEPAAVEEIEWYLLARLAAQRQVSFAGSVPIVVDRALDVVDDTGVVHLLERLERMAGAVQVVHLTDDHRIVRWATDSGEDRVAVSRPNVSVAD